MKGQTSKNIKSAFLLLLLEYWDKEELLEFCFFILDLYFENITSFKNKILPF